MPFFDTEYLTNGYRYGHRYYTKRIGNHESSTGAKVLSMVFSLPGTKVQRNEKAWNLSNGTNFDDPSDL